MCMAPVHACRPVSSSWRPQVDFSSRCRRRLMKQQKARMGNWRLDYNLRAACEADVLVHCQARAALKPTLLRGLSPGPLPGARSAARTCLSPEAPLASLPFALYPIPYSAPHTQTSHMNSVSPQPRVLILQPSASPAPSPPVPAHGSGAASWSAAHSRPPCRCCRAQ